MKAITSIAFALALGSAAAAQGPSRPFASSGWLDASAQPRETPNTTLIETCTEIGCRDTAWIRLLEDRRERPLTAAPGGRAYRYFVDYYEVGLGLKIVRLEVTADGAATLSWSYPGSPPQSRAISPQTLAAFDAALAASRFDAAEVSAAPTCVADGDEVVFEAVANGRYKFVVEPCGGEAGLRRAMDILDGQT